LLAQWVDAPQDYVQEFGGVPAVDVDGAPTVEFEELLM
jgi:hypothetical protein